MAMDLSSYESSSDEPLSLALMLTSSDEEFYDWTTLQLTPATNNPDFEDHERFEAYCAATYESQPNIRFLGSGLEARCYVEDEQVVIKVFERGLYGLRCLQREAYCLGQLARLNAPAFIPEVVGCSIIKHELRLKYLPGGKSLDQLFVTETGGVPCLEDEFKDIFPALLEAVAWLHTHHWVHADLFPSNVVWSRELKALQLIDFTQSEHILQ
jgi:serine/threonine protein kinase